jgi:hypothetical protein
LEKASNDHTSPACTPALLPREDENGALFISERARLEHAILEKLVKCLADVKGGRIIPTKSGETFHFYRRNWSRGSSIIWRSFLDQRIYFKSDFLYHFQKAGGLSKQSPNHLSPIPDPPAAAETSLPFLRSLLAAIQKSYGSFPK